MAGVKRAATSILVALLTVALIVSAVYFYHEWQHWLAANTGSENNSSTPPDYNYWSGFGSVFPWSMGILAALLNNGYQAAKRSNCHTHRCWRIGSYPIGDYRVCKKHHFEVKGTHPTVEHLQEVHASLEVADNQDEAAAACASCAGGCPGSAGPSAPSA
jgi:hypothetical protein